jgi:hypothetical protein
MNNVEAVDPTSSNDPDVHNQADVQEAFQMGLIKFMITMLQGAESDVVSAINDNTSDPDAVG